MEFIEFPDADGYVFEGPFYQVNVAVFCIYTLITEPKMDRDPLYIWMLGCKQSFLSKCRLEIVD